MNKRKWYKLAKYNENITCRVMCQCNVYKLMCLLTKSFNLSWLTWLQSFILIKQSVEHKDVTFNWQVFLLNSVSCVMYINNLYMYIYKLTWMRQFYGNIYFVSLHFRKMEKIEIIQNSCMYAPSIVVFWQNAFYDSMKNKFNNWE